MPWRLDGVRDGVGWPEYEKRFLCGVEGVPEGGGNDIDVLVGGVCDRPDLRMLALSVGDSFWANTCGTDPSNISWRSTAEYVLLASSAATLLVITRHDFGRVAYSSGSAARCEACACAYLTE